MRTRQPAPPFRRGRVVAIAEAPAGLRRVVVEGSELTEMDRAGVGASVRLLLPPAPDRPVDRPVWSGNAYFAADGTRPPIRTMTPLDQDPVVGRLAFEVVRHDGGRLTPWVDAVEVGGEVAVSGPSRGYQLAPGLATLALLGDRSAIPAIRQLVAVAPAHLRVDVVVEGAPPGDDLGLADHPGLRLQVTAAPLGGPPGDTLVEAAARLELDDTAHLWAAGEAAAMQRIRRLLFEVRGRPRTVAHVRGYWKHGRSEEDSAG